MEPETASPFFFALCGLWGVGVIGLLISATRLCYRIEARSGRALLKGGLGLSGYANVVPVAFNVGVAKDEETQALRRRMNRRLMVMLACFAAFWLFLKASGV